MNWAVMVAVLPREGISDPEGKAVAEAKKIKKKKLKVNKNYIKSLCIEATSRIC
jgi:phosphoribosylformylglycinamidine (FGAM) synthase PurS component